MGWILACASTRRPAYNPSVPPSSTDIRGVEAPTPTALPSSADVVVVGAGAAGLAATIFAARRRTDLRIVAIDGASRIGAKILVSGGGRCNVTNRVVTPDDFFGGNRNLIRRVLSAFPADRARDFFQELGVALHEEEWGKLFPDSNLARTVLDALLNEAGRLGARVIPCQRVVDIGRHGDGFNLRTTTGAISAQCVVLATGGLSLPKTGSDGGGYELARGLGHSLVPTTPGLDPLLLDGDFHTPLSGISLDVELAASVGSDKPIHTRAPMLWTHFGVSGPAAMNVSRVWHRAAIEGRAIRITANLLPDEDSASLDRKLTAAEAGATTALGNVLARWLPARLADAILCHLGIDRSITMSHVSKDNRRKLVDALQRWLLPVRGGRGYLFAEVTAGGVPLGEVDVGSMESRVCPGLFLVGEILDVDGRIGGYNFQWAWSSGFVAGLGIERKRNRP